MPLVRFVCLPPFHVPRVALTRSWPLATAIQGRKRSNEQTAERLSSAGACSHPIIRIDVASHAVTVGSTRLIRTGLRVRTCAGGLKSSKMPERRSNNCMQRTRRLRFVSMSNVYRRRVADAFRYFHKQSVNERIARRQAPHEHAFPNH